MPQNFRSPLRGLTTAYQGPSAAPGIPNAAEAAGTLQSGPGTANEAIKLYRLRQEAVSREQGQSNPNQAVLGLLNKDIAEDPYTGQAAMAQGAENENQYQSAVSAGFRGTDPVAEANEYTRKQAESKINAPVEAARIAGQFDVQQQEEASRGAANVANINQSGIAARNQAFSDLIQGGGMSNLSSFNPQSGAMGFRAPQQRPAGVDQDVTIAKQNLAKARSGAFGGGNAATIAEAQLRSAAESALARFNLSPEDKQEVLTALVDPRYKGKRLEEAFDMSQMSPQEQQELSNFYTLIGGF
jgi:hypothetical protein